MNTCLQSLLLIAARAICMAGFLCLLTSCDDENGELSITTPGNGMRLTTLADISGTYQNGSHTGNLNNVRLTLMRNLDNKYWNGTSWGSSFFLPTTFGGGSWQIASGTALPSGAELGDDYYLITAVGELDTTETIEQSSIFIVGYPAPPVFPSPWAWGSNDNGRLGAGAVPNAGSPIPVFMRGALEGKLVATMAAGDHHTLALSVEGLLYSWGDDFLGQLGSTAPPGAVNSTFFTPVKVDDTGVMSGKRIAAMAAGQAHSLAASAPPEGLVFAWGSNTEGQLGNNAFGANLKSELPIAVGGLLTGKIIVAVSAGFGHSLALADSGEVYAWGDNSNRQLGDGTTNTRSTVPVAVAGLGGIIIRAIDCGDYYSMALTDDGNVYAWGLGSSGQLGNGSTSDSNVPLLITGPWGARKVVSISAGFGHSLAVDEDGKVYAWGLNTKGQLGTGNFTAQLAPVLVTALSTQFVTSVHAGEKFSIAVTRDNKVFSWGEDDFGQLSRSTPDDDPNPGEANVSVALSGGRVILGLSTGYRHVEMLTGFPVLPAPEIEVEAQGTELADGGSLNFGTVGQGSSNPIFITVRNRGTGDLKDLSASISGTGFSGIFTAPPLATGDDTGFYVTFNPNTVGAASGTVQIFSDDADENPFDITLTGSAYPLGQVDLAFDPGVTGDVYGTAVQPDGNAVVTGSFVQVNASGTPVARNRAARVLGATGVADAFNPDLDSFSYCSAVLPDGKIMVGGAFTTVGGVARNRLARLNADGTLDTSFNAQITFTGTVYAMALQADGKLVVAGNFSGIGGGTQPNLARLNADGTLDAGFTPALSSSGRSVAVQADGSIVVLMSLSASERTVARLSGADGSLDPGFTRPTIITDGNPLLDCVAMQPDGKILVGGYVKTVNGETRNGICRINTDGSLDMGFDPNVGGTFPQVTSIVVQADKRILISGTFTSVGGQTRNRIAKLLPNGQLEQFFDPNADSGVFGVTLQADGKILACGGFSNIGGVARSKLARLSNDVATQSLSVVDNNSRIEWLRGGSAPETNLVTFDVSGDGGATWTPLGPATRVTFPSPGWQLTGAALPPTGHIRARAYPQGGRYNGSVSCLETITAYGTPPDIVVTENSISLSSGFTRDFGVVATGRSSAVMQLTLQNVGGTTLTGLSGVTITDDVWEPGDHTTQFQLGKPADISLAPGGTTTMTVTYRPRASVTTIDQPGSNARHWAWLRIPSDDPDENPIDIRLTGMGGLPFTTYKEQDNGDSASPDTDDSDGNGQSDLQGYATRTTAASADGDGTSIQPPSGGGGSFAPSTFAGENEAGDPPPEPTFLFHYRRNKLALADIIYQVEWSDTLADNDWHTTGVTEIILSDDDSIQQVQATVPAGTAGHRFVRLKMTRP